MVSAYEEFRTRYPMKAVMESDGHTFRGSKTLCPFHDDHNPSFSIKDDRGKCFSCDWSGDVIDYLAARTSKTPQEIVGMEAPPTSLPPRAFVPEPEAEAPPEPFHYVQAWDTFTEWNQALLENRALMSWLAARGVDRQACIMNWLGYTTDVKGLNLKSPEPMLVMPNFAPDSSKEFVSVEARFLRHKQGQRWPPKYMTTGRRELWHLDMLYRDAGRMVILLESVLDAIAINRWAMAHIATAMFASGFNELHARQLAPFQSVFVIADPGEPGQKHAAKIKSMIESTHIVNLGADIGDLYREDADHAMQTVEELVSPFYGLIENAPLRLMSIEGISL